MNLGKYIQQLIPEHDTVIIPGLGAFISKIKPARLDEETGEMAPPSKEVSFEARIRNNDGLLAGKIAEEEGIPFTEANRLLDSECEEILYQLDKGNQVQLKGLGVLLFNQDRVIQFTSAGKDFLLLDSYGLGVTSLKDAPEEKPAEPDPIPTAKDETSDPFRERRPLAYEKVSLHNRNEAGRKKRRTWWLLLLLIPLIAAAIYIISRDTDVPPAKVEYTVTQPEPAIIPPVTDTTAQDTLSQQEPFTQMATDEITDSSGFITPDTSKYYLIRGSFEDFENAQKFFLKLKGEGYEPFHIGKVGSFFLVGINIYDNPIIAYGQQYNYLDNHPESGVWIYAPGQKRKPANNIDTLKIHLGDSIPEE